MLEIARLVHCKFFFILFIVLVYSEYPAQVYPEKKIDSLLKIGIEHIVSQDYASAEKTFLKLNKEYSHLPLGKIYLAANKISEAYDYKQDFDEEYILENLESAKEQSQKLIEKDDSNIWYHYFFALSEGYLSYFDAIQGSWFSALSTGINSIAEFEKILYEDKNFYDAYIAIGTFEYWKSRKLEFMDWLPFANDSKSIGIKSLIIAIDSSSYNSHLAINSLIWIYIDQKKYGEAIKVAEKSLIDFPQSRTFKWGLARAYEEIEPSKAINLYLEILHSYPDAMRANYKNEIILKHLIAQQYAKLGKNETAIKFCDEILAMKNIPEKTLDDLSERIERVRTLKTELSKNR